MEISNMVCRIFYSKTFKLGDVGRELGWNSRPTRVMVYGFIYQLVKIGKTEACHIGEQGNSWSRSCCGSTSSIPIIRARATTCVRS